MTERDHGRPNHYECKVPGCTLDGHKRRRYLMEVTEQQAVEWVDRHFDRNPDGSVTSPKRGRDLVDVSPARTALAEILADPDHVELCQGQPSEADCLIEGLSDRGFVIRRVDGVTTL